MCLLTVSGDKRAINWRIGAACFHMARLQCLKRVAKNIEKEEGFGEIQHLYMMQLAAKVFHISNPFIYYLSHTLYSLPSTSYIAPVFL